MSVPEHAMAFLNTWFSEQAITFPIVQYDHAVTIDAPPVPDYLELPDEGILDIPLIYARCAWTKRLQDIIETLIHTVDFMSINSALLAPTPDGGYVLVPKEPAEKYYPVECRTRRPVIDVMEVKTTQWRSESIRRGVWRGRTIEMVVACSHGSSRQVKAFDENLASLAAAELDLFYPVIGHLVHNGDIVGLVLEPHDGEYIQEYDNAAIIDVFQQLESKDMFFQCSIDFKCMMISREGKIRLVGSGLYVQPFAEFYRPFPREEVRRLHWSYLDDLLDQLTRHSENLPGTDFLDFYTFDKQLRILTYIPLPEQPLAIEITLTPRQRAQWQKHRRAQRTSGRKFLLSAAEEASTSDLDVRARDSDEDAPLSHRRIGIRVRTLPRQSNMYEPYQRGPKIARLRSVWGEDSDVTAENLPLIKQ